MSAIKTILDPHMTQNLAMLSSQHQHACLLSDAADDITERGITMVVGSTGTGKTTLLRLWTADYLPHRGEEARLIPVVCVNVPVHPSITDVYNSILFGLGVKEPSRLKRFDRERRAEDLIARCGVRTIVFEESNHFAERANALTVANAADAIKVLLETTHLSAIFAGTEATEGLLGKNAQLQSRTTNVIRLQPLECRTKDGMSFSQVFMELAEEQLAFPEASNLNSSDVVERIITGTAGSKRRIVNLLNSAALIARSERARRITVQHLAKAYESMPRLATVKSNPFR